MMLDTILIGKGNLLISVTMNSMIIRQMKEIKDIGSSLELKDVDYGRVFQLNFLNKNQVESFRSLLKDAHANPVFEFQGFKFNFIEYSRKSVDVLLD